MLTIDDLATPAAVQELAADIHPDDAAELLAGGTDVHQALAGVPLRALRWHGRLIALFGCVEQPGGGIPWMLCTRALADVPRQAMAGISALVVDEWRGQFDALTNLVHRHNARALRFVRWLGFTVDATPCGPGGEFFVFHWRRHV